jgi:hypothetical protein
VVSFAGAGSERLLQLQSKLMQSSSPSSSIDVAKTWPSERLPAVLPEAHRSPARSLSPMLATQYAR